MKKEFILVPFLVLFFLFFPKQVFADTLGTISDTITTSRPSAAATLASVQLVNAGQVSVVDNGSLWLASDSALMKDPINIGNSDAVSIASQSAVSGGNRTVSFYNTAAHYHGQGSPLIFPVTAMHTIQFTTVSTIPLSGNIILTFPTLSTGDANNPASPSASTFQLNNIATAQIKVTSGASDVTTADFNSNGGTITATNPTNGTAPYITFHMANNQTIAAGSVIRIFLGCTAVNGTPACTAQAPMIINPTQNGVVTGTGRSWKLTLVTQDGALNPLDNGNVAIATIDSVRVRANVDAFLTLTIAPINNGTTISSDNNVGSCTSDGSVTNTGISPTAASVDLGDLGGGISIAAQKISVTTNGQGGYTLTATSSGHLINPANGYFINDSTTPIVMTSGGTMSYFGIHPCGINVTGALLTQWVNGGPGTGKFAWPTQTSALTLASQSPGPIGTGTGRANDGITDVEYAATIMPIVPAGEYESAITYVATATF